MATALVLFARFPEPGRVKTRLAAAIGPEIALALYSAFLSDLVRRFQNVCDQRVLACTPDSSESFEFFRTLAADRFTLWPQPEGSLGTRLADCFETHLREFDNVIVIGSDAPTLPAQFIAEADEALATSDCVLGPAIDGGYYLVGLQKPCPELFAGIDWDGPSVLEQTVHRVRSAGLSLHLLPPWYDVDTVEDLHALRGHVAALRAAGIDPDLPQTEQVLEMWSGV